MAFLEEYTLLRELGQGGFATVYKVRHNELGYIRAVRVLNNPIKSKDDDLYRKFLNECRILLRLGNGNHSGIVHVYKPDLLYDSFNSHYKAVVEMDYVDGKDLLHYLADNKYFLPADEVIRMVEEMSSALAYCHEDIYYFCKDREADKLEPDPIDGSKLLIDDAIRQRLINKYKVIHNDIHSRNIMRRENGDFVLLDFGLAIDGKEVSVSSSRRKAGALEYLSPEKWEQTEVLTTQSDIYSFGVVMYEYLTGRLPFKMAGDSFVDQKKLYDQVLGQSVPSIFEMRKASYEAKYHDENYVKDYPDWLETVILKCLEKDPDRRFKDGKELYGFVTKHIGDKNGNDEEVKELKRIIKEKDVQINILQIENDKLNVENKVLSDRNVQLETDNASLKEENADLKHQIESKEKSVVSLKNRIHKVIVLCSVVSVVAVGVCLYVSLSGVTGTSNAKSEELQQTVDSLMSVQKSADSLQMVYSDSIVGLNAQIDSINKNFNDMLDENNSLYNRLDELTEKLTKSKK